MKQLYGWLPTGKLLKTYRQQGTIICLKSFK